MDIEYNVYKRKLPHRRLSGSIYYIIFTLLKGALSPEEISIVLDHQKWGDGQFYDLICVVVMPDHVHLVLRPKDGVLLSRIMKGIKGVSARKINLKRGTDEELWQDEYMDRIIRDDEEFSQKLKYMIENPLRAGLVDDVWDYKGLYYKEEL